MGKVYIIGAHSRAQTLAVYLKYLYPDVAVEAYLVNNEEKNAELIDGVPVIRLSRFSSAYGDYLGSRAETLGVYNQHVELHTEYPVYIGTRGIYHKKLIREFQQYGFKEIYPVTVEMDLQLRNAYLDKYYASIGRGFNKIDKLDRATVAADRRPSRTIYVVRSIFDKDLQQPYKLADYEKEIQAGAALTEKRLSEGILTDACGDSISSQNRQFCELTVMYWIWKNAIEDVVGMVHYRRHFNLPDDWYERFEAYKIDVILPTPLYVAPSLAGNYKARHDPSDWEYMMEYLKKQDKETYQSAEAFFDQNLYSPCNMFIMRITVLNDLCEWLFSILHAVVAHGRQKKDSYMNRYPGFISERLISYFFDRYRDRYKIVYADKGFLS